MPYAAPDPTPYQSNLMPINTRIVTVKRGDGATAGGGGSPTTVGTYLLENFQVTRGAKIIDRTGIYGEQVGTPTVVRDTLSFSAKAQIDNTLTNMIHPGDYFEEIVDIDAGAVSANKVRFIIGPPVKDETAGTPHSYSLSGSEDMPHSTQYGGS